MCPGQQGRWEVADGDVENLRDGAPGLRPTECLQKPSSHIQEVLCCAVLSHSVVSDSVRPRGLQPSRLLCPWDSPGKNTGVDCHAFLQGIFPTLGSNPGLLHCRQVLYHLSHQGSPRILEWVTYPSPRELPDPGVNPGSLVLQADSLPAELPGKPIFRISPGIK